LVSEAKGIINNPHPLLKKEQEVAIGQSPLAHSWKEIDAQSNISGAITHIGLSNNHMSFQNNVCLPFSLYPCLLDTHIPEQN
jgi:hypothetical protein